MNKVILVGRLTKDAEIRTTQTGKKVASFSIAVDDGKDSSGQRLTSYFNCTAWDSLADLIEQFVKKGHRLAVTGKLQNRSWDKPDGTKGYATDISVRELEMLTTKAEADTIANSSSSNDSTNAPSSNTSPASKPAATKAPETELPEIDVDSINSVQMPF
jgi:single-strand DNA-binding protein